MNAKSEALELNQLGCKSSQANMQFKMNNLQLSAPRFYGNNIFTVKIW